ncbi:CRISPR-associated helicase/endonuclease Cas3 [Nocardia higoensis]|uniref:CRISPR-associated helicase/endonuclease Cas3 n=1 Tax=Nocardia higoensis TaxID=228599 RepID=UPI0009FE885A|nr:CRISPR-associated helicase/endonuclease Cas3 [Nocardia higoensis]
MLSRATLSAWAKSDREGGSLSLVRHLADSAEVAKLVWDLWLPPHTRRVIAAELAGGESDGQLLLRWLAGVHDIGKLTPAFACQMPALADAMDAKGLKMPRALGNRNELPHGLAGQISVMDFLVDAGWDAATAITYAVVVGSHHGVPPNTGQAYFARSQRNLLGSGQWEQSRRELLEFVTNRIGAADRLDAWRTVPLSPAQQCLLTAAVIVCDWIASNQDLFPLDEARVSSEAAPLAWRVLGLPGPWQPAAVGVTGEADGHDFVRQRFGWPVSVRARPLQLECVRIASEIPEPGLMVVEAPMGEGKTEAALAAAEILAQRFGFGGVFVALPTMATSDAMFARVRRWVANLPDTPATMFLAHGRAALNPEFTELRRGFDSIGTDCSDSHVIAHEWFVGKKGPLANIVVGTIDQVLRTALKSRHVMLRHLAIANKVVVIDEVHAADSYMSTYLCRTLEWLAAYGVPVVLLSATLPPAQRELLTEAYRRGRGDGGGRVEEVGGYPSITVWPNPEFGSEVPPSGRCIAGIGIERIGDDAGGLARQLSEASRELGGVIGVVCNTVARAQETYDAMIEAGFGDDEVLLVHSRFVAHHRAALESRLRSLLGPPGEAQRPHRFVVVGTQVIEQSLDIDLDLLITDLAPMDLLLQRIGRLHRHLRDMRPTWVARPKCLIRGANWEAVPPEPIVGSQRIYGGSRLLRAAAVLDARTAVTVPADVPELVSCAYTEDIVVPAAWGDAVEAADTQWHAFIENQRVKAQSYLLAGPDSMNRTLMDWLTAAVPDAEGAGGQAQVRDAEDSIEAIVVQRIGEALHTLGDTPGAEGCLIPTETAPPAKLAKQVAASTIRLPAFLSRYGNTDRVIRVLENNWYPGWQESHWLKGELVLELDEKYRAEVAGYRLVYDIRRGLLVTSAEEGQ